MFPTTELKPGETYQNTILFPVLSAAIAIAAISISQSASSAYGQPCHQRQRSARLLMPATNAVAVVAAATSFRNGVQHLDWFVIALFGLGMIATVWYSMPEKERVRQGLLPVRPRRQLAADRFPRSTPPTSAPNIWSVWPAPVLSPALAMAHWKCMAGSYWCWLAFVPLYDRMKYSPCPSSWNSPLQPRSRQRPEACSPWPALVLTKMPPPSTPAT